MPRATRRDLLRAGALAALPLPAAARGARDNTLRVAFQAAETGFDPAQVQDLYSRRVLMHIMDAPLEYDLHARPWRLRPNTLAALPEVSADYRTITCRVQPGIFFADDPAFGGRRRELVAADYVYSIKRIYDPRWKSPMLFLLENSRVLGLPELRAQALAGGRFDYDREVDGLRALDRYTFQFRLAEPSPRFAFKLVDTTCCAVAREVVEAHGDAIMSHPVGTGPYRLESWTRSARIVLARNPNFRERHFDYEAPADAPELAPELAALRGRRLPLAERVEIVVIEESQPRWLAFLQGDLDLIDPVPVDLARMAAPRMQLAPYLARRAVKARFTPMLDVALDYFNMEHPLVGGTTPEKVALRRAVALAFDNLEYIRAVFSDQALPAQSAFVPGTFGHDPAWATLPVRHDPVRARALLDSFGYLDRDGDGWRETPDGEPLVLELASSATQRERLQNEIWRKSMAAVGLKMDFRIAQWPELLRLSLAGKLMMWGYAWQMSEPDSELVFGMAYGPNRETLNDARFELPAFDRLFEAQQRLPDGPQRQAVLREAARIMAAQMPYLLKLHRVYLDLAQPWVLGYRRHPLTERYWHTVAVDGASRAAT